MHADALNCTYSYCTDASRLELGDVCDPNTMHLKLIDFCIEQLNNVIMQSDAFFFIIYFIIGIV